MQKGLNEHKKQLAASERNLLENFGDDSDAVSSIADQRQNIDKKLQKASELATALQDRVDVLERSRQQLSNDVSAVDSALSELRQELNKVDTAGLPPSADDDMGQKLDTLLVCCCCFIYVRFRGLITMYIGSILIYK